MRTLVFAAAVSLVVSATASAQTTDWRFRWRQGDVQHYRVEHITTVNEALGDKILETMSRIEITKRWEVLSVDAQGIATVQMSIVEMRNEQTRPNREVLLFDSRSPETSTPDLRDQLSKYVNQPLAVLRVDGQGRVVAVVQGSVNRYEAEPPFGLTLPPGGAQSGQTWTRDYTITADPPHGKGERFGAQQKYSCFRIGEGTATCAVTTILAISRLTKPQQMAVAQMVPEGEVTFNLQYGRLQRARLAIDRRVDDHQGPGTSYRFQSTYNEEYVER